MSEVMEQLSLDQLLEKASSEPQYRPEFYKRLLTDDLAVIMQRTAPPLPEDSDDDADVVIASFPDGVIPVFTSVEKIYDKGVNTEQLLHMQLPGDKMLALLKGQTLVLNPYSDFGKKFLPEEVDRMLDGSIFEPGAIDMQLPQPQQVRLGIPAVYPENAMKALSELFANRPMIKSAYVGMIQVQEDRPPHYIYAVEGDGDLNPMAQEMGMLIQSTRPGEMFDLVRIPGNTFDEFFYKHHKPFYTK